MSMNIVTIISLEATRNAAYVWVEYDDEYVKYTVYPKSTEVMEKHPKSEYTDYEHFVGVMGKFCPFTAFLIEPIQLPLRYKALSEEANRRQAMNNQNLQESK